RENSTPGWMNNFSQLLNNNRASPSNLDIDQWDDNLGASALRMFEMSTPLVPPFTRETAILKVRAAENNWNSRNTEQVARGYTVDSRWRNRSEFIDGRDEIIAFLTRKWSKELDYRLI